MEPQLKPVPTGNRPFSSWPQAAETTVVVEQSQVLRNTYWLLALSMLPTIAGAYVGMSMNFAAVFATSPIMAPLLMFAAMFGMLFVVSALRNSAWGVLAIFGFTFVSGVMLAPMLQYAAGLRNGGQLVALAGGMTAAVFVVMAAIATISKRDFSFLGKFLFVGLILLIIASLANIFFQVPVASIAISAIAVMIFSLYLLYDVSSIVRGGQTNYIMATLALFLDIFNIFVNLLNLLLIFTGSRD
ncbi:MAG: Bax inhibitor-1/YccA family protein [Pseudomonadota bacterium]|nr:Bax inhibitor-1/YccA family protein [Pseudomonadota bacterium]